MHAPPTRRIDRWHLVVLVSAGALLWLALWVFAEMVDDVPKGEFAGWDGPTVQFMRDAPGSPQGTAAAAGIARGITRLGSGFVLTGIVAGGIAWLTAVRRARAAVVLLAATLGASLLTLGLKHHFQRVRPNTVPHLVDESSWSFPSGHSLSSAAVYITVGVLLARRLATRKWQVALVAGAFFLSFLIGLSRIYLGVHYPTDVLAGWSAGTAWAIVCSGSLVWWEHQAGARAMPVA